MRASLRSSRHTIKTRVCSTTTSRVSAEGDSFLGQPPHVRETILRHITMSTCWVIMVDGDAMRDAQAGVPSAEWLRAQLAFKNSMVHGILQFTPSIAFCYVLHRCVSRDIRCRESFVIKKSPRAACTPRTGQHGTSPSHFRFPWHMPCRGFVIVQHHIYGTPKEAPHTHAGRGWGQGPRPISPSPSCIYEFTGRSALQVRQ